MPVLKGKTLFQSMAHAISDYHSRSRMVKAELDLSGGIDSGVMAVLLKEAVGAENLILVHSRFSTSPEQSVRASLLAERLDVPLIIADFSFIYKELVAEIISSALEANPGWDGMIAHTQNNPVVMGSLRSTLRAPIGRFYNRLLGGGIRHGTGNKCEDEFLRYYQKGGDGEVDTNPMEMLSKTEVYQLAYTIGRLFPELEGVMLYLIEATPSADLWGSDVVQTDEAEMRDWTGVPFTYGKLKHDGSVLRYGTIERVSALLNCVGLFPGDKYLGATRSVRDVLFAANPPSGLFIDRMVDIAKATKIFPETEFDEGQVASFLLAARKAEAVTRHKWNPGIPSILSRTDMIVGGILTNDFSTDVSQYWEL